MDRGPSPALEALRPALARRDAGNASPLAVALLRALRHNPSWRRETPSWIAVALWAHEWVASKPTRDEIAAAAAELKEARRAAA